MRRLFAPAVILILPVLLRLPFWLAGLRESPVWQVAEISLPGSYQIFPGLPLSVDPNAGWTTQALGTFAARTWLEGHIPWWDPFSGIGMPLAAEMQSSALFVPYILLLALPAGYVLLGLSLQWTAGLATLGLLRRLELSERAALTGALLFTFCASFAWIGPPMSLPCAFLATFLLGLERARSAAAVGHGAGWRLIALSVALSITAGFPETAYLDGLLALLWAAVRLAGARGHRAAFAWRVALGGVAGLLLAAPALWTFLDFLPAATLGARGHADYSLLSLSSDSLVQFLFPYALGFPAGLSRFDPSLHLFVLWGRSGGYIGMALALAALIGVFAPGRHRVLRIAMAIWAALLISRNVGVPGAAALMNLIPFHDQLQTFRYAGASWLMPFCILAAYALDSTPSRPGAAVLAAVLAVLGAVTAWLAWPLAQPIVEMVPYFEISLVCGAGVLALAVWAYASGRRVGFAAILVVESAALFAATLVCGQVGGRLDTAGLDTLRTRAGLQRTTTLGPLLPNYGALFRIPSVNYSYLPAPAVWADYAGTHLRPGVSVLFTGISDAGAPASPTLAEILSGHLGDYAALGVRYVIARPGVSPFSRSEPPPSLDHAEPLRLEAGATLSGTIRADATGGPITGLQVMIGTYAGVSTGQLWVEICAGDDCAHGAAQLASAVDNAPVEIPLDHPLSPAAGDLAWTLRHETGEPVAIWRWPSPDGPRPHVAPAYPRAASEPALVYADPAVAIYELPEAAPYASAPGCTLDIATRTDMTARCDAPSTLIRRELSWPGWRADLAGRTVTPTADGLFQSVELPAGTTRVRFDYRPPGFGAFTALFCLGLLALLPWHSIPRRRAILHP